MIDTKKLTHPQVLHPSALLKKEKTFNDKLATFLGNSLGSMGFFYICVILDLAELPSVISAHSVLVWVTYIAQTVIQLIALPIISTQQNIQQKQGEAKADVDHHTLTYLATIQDEQLEILKDLQSKVS
jgi:hypothetical protein